MFDYYYHENLRKTIVAFATLFNNVYIRETNSNGDVTKHNKVPIRYGPRAKFLARIDEAPNDLNNPVQITLPIMSFEYDGLTYDGERKIVTTEYFTVTDPDNPLGCVRSYMPVPYNMSIQLNIMAKLEKDCWQIIEQILPIFQPAYTLTIKYTGIEEKKDVPIQLDSIQIQDDYEGNYESRRALIYTLRFTAKLYLFGSQKSIDDIIIRKSTIGFGAIATNGDPLLRELDSVYQALPTATKPYSNTYAATLEKDLSLNDTIAYLNTVANIEVGDILGINNESLLVTYINQTNKYATVLRASFNTRSELHVKGTEVKKVVEADNDLIEPGDEFGVNGGYIL